MPSTVIRRFAYCPDSSELWVEFTTGRRYVYSDVPREVADTFRSAFAKGVYFNLKCVRDNLSHGSDANELGVQEPLDGAAVGGGDHLVCDGRRQLSAAGRQLVSKFG